MFHFWASRAVKEGYNCGLQIETSTHFDTIVLTAIQISTEKREKQNMLQE